MKESKPVKKERILALSWLVTYIGFGLVDKAIELRHLVRGEPRFQLLTPYHWWLLCETSVLYLWLHVVRYYAKKAAWKPVVILATAFLCVFTVWLIALIAMTILAVCHVIEP